MFNRNIRNDTGITYPLPDCFFDGSIFGNQKKDIFENNINFKNMKLHMTLVYGARCKDGVVIVSDRQVSKLDDSDNRFSNVYSTKIEHLEKSNIVFANSGLPIHKILSDNFKTNTKEGIDDFQSLVVKYLINIRAQTSQVVNFLIAFKNKNGRAELYQIDTNYCFFSYSDEIMKIGCILNEPFCKYWNKDMTMKESAKLFSFIIRYAEIEKLCYGVGVGDKKPQIYFIPDNGDAYECIDIELDELVGNLDEKVNNVVNIVGSKSNGSFFK